MNKIDLCKGIKANVSRLTSNELIELFKIIKECDINYTKNNNGIFLNLNWISKENLIKINNYILFCIKSQNEIYKYDEVMKNLLNDPISNNLIEKKDTASKSLIDNNNIATPKQKFSSSMKFYLLKKKFNKLNSNHNNICENNLECEDYLMS
jgi:hypothetical protein